MQRQENRQTSDIRVGRACRAFLDVIDQAGVQPLIRAASEFFSAPVVLTDGRFHIRAVWPREATGLPELDECIRRNVMEAEREWKILDENLAGGKEFYEPFYACTGLCTDLPRLYGELVWENEVLGHVIVYLGRIPFRQEDLEIVRKLVSLLSIKLIRRQAGMDRWTATLQAKLEVLLDPSTPPQVCQPAVELLGQEIKGEYGVMVTTIGARPSQKAFADYAVAQIQQQFRNVVVLVYDRTIVTLLGEVKRNAVDGQLRPENNSLVRWLFQYFGQYDLVSGLSDSFSDLNRAVSPLSPGTADCPDGRATQGQEKRSVSGFYAPPHAGCGAGDGSAETFVAPVLYEIRDYDRANQTEYFPTIFQYAVCLGDKDAAAAGLSIHKNTLSYRLNRITELFQVDFSDRRARLNLELSCFLWYLTQDTDQLPHPGSIFSGQ